VFFGSKYQIIDGKIAMTISKDVENYIRVGDNYYELIKVPSIYDDNLHIRREKRNRATIKEDIGSKQMQHIKKYKTFINIPDNINYKQVINDCYNVYYPLPYEPNEGMWDTIKFFIKHIFDEQYEMGLDYIQLCYQQPTQTLPILCLVSKERGTGKTTFLNFMNLIFGENCVIVGEEILFSQFNTHTATRLLICSEEVSADDNKKATEVLKRRSTSKKIAIEGKGENAYEIESFSKYIIASNYETNFIYTQEEETRFWVRKINHIEKEITDIEKLLQDEIPAFLFFS
jgi:hypothetical protein